MPRPMAPCQFCGAVEAVLAPGMMALVFRAGVAQLAERQPSKLNVAGSIPVSRSNFRRTNDPWQARGRLTSGEANQLPKAVAQSAAEASSNGTE